MSGADPGSEDEPTEPPTARRLADARRRGRVAYSHDLQGAVALAATFAALVALAPSIVGQLTSLFAAALARAPRGAPFGDAISLAVDSAVRVLAVPLMTAFVFTLGAGLLQTGGLWVTASARREAPRRSSLSAALRRIRGGGAAGEAGRGIAKLVILTGVVGLTLWPLASRLGMLAGAPPRQALGAFGTTARLLGGRMVVAVALIGLADYLLARRRHHRALGMTRRELERERKETEGDPAHRAERRRLYRQMDPQMDPQMDSPWAIAAVAQADFVVTGGGEGETLAAAVAYDRAGDRAGDRVRDRPPVVVAAGRRLMAARIVDAARAARVPIFADADLARALCALEVGAPIPAASYDQVAEFLHVTYGPGSPIRSQ